MTQPEPESGYALSAKGSLWRKASDGTWETCLMRGRQWESVSYAYGPMIPLLPAERPDNVPEDAVPFVGWVAYGVHSRFTASDMERPGDSYVCCYGPAGEVFTDSISLDDAGSYGLPVPPKPEPPEEQMVEIGGQRMTQAQFDAARYPLLHPDPGPAKPESTLAERLREGAEQLEAGGKRGFAMVHIDIVGTLHEAADELENRR